MSVPVSHGEEKLCQAAAAAVSVPFLQISKCEMSELCFPCSQRGSNGEFRSQKHLTKKTTRMCLFSSNPLLKCVVFAGVAGEQSRAGQDSCVLMANSHAEMEEWVKSIQRALGSASGGKRGAGTAPGGGDLPLPWGLQRFGVRGSKLGSEIPGKRGWDVSLATPLEAAPGSAPALGLLQTRAVVRKARPEQTFLGWLHLLLSTSSWAF